MMNELNLDRIMEALYAMRHDSGINGEYSGAAAEMADVILLSLSNTERRELEARAFRAADSIRLRERNSL